MKEQLPNYRDDDVSTVKIRFHTRAREVREHYVIEPKNISSDFVRAFDLYGIKKQVLEYKVDVTTTPYEIRSVKLETFL
jgi:hypothetical protein